MGIRNLCNILRFFATPHPCSTFFFTHLFSNTAPIFHSQSSFLSSTGYTQIRSFKHPFARSSSSTLCFDFHDGHSCLKLGLRRYFCSYPYSSYKDRPYATWKQVSEIVALVREGVSDLEFTLNRMNVSLSMASIVEIFQ